MSAWTCPKCHRLFGRSRQSHECAPGLTLDEYFGTGPAHERPVVEAIVGHLSTLGPLHLDIVSVGIFLKNPTKFAELRPMERWVAASFWLPSRAQHPTITRKVNVYGARFWHVANIATVAEIDEPFRELLTGAYRSAG